MANYTLTGAWQEVTLPFTSFACSWRGQPVSWCPALSTQLAQLTEVALGTSFPGTAGKFHVEIRSIAATKGKVGAPAVEGDTTTVYTLEGVAKTGDCGQVDLPTKYVSYAEKFDKNLKTGTCASVGYSVPDGTTTRHVPVLGDITAKKFKKA